ncbi:hypothetical protein J7J81_02840 [bacterium]|nr:hypothetical protein [bacterium]
MGDYIYIINSRGEKEPFSLKKVRRSARRVGASRELAKEIAGVLQKEAYPGIRSSEIFRRIKQILHRETPGAALRFNLKKAMRKLGPTGFPFEKYIGEIFKYNGFEVKLNPYIPGFCCRSYELDLLARKDNLLYVGECKYHHLPQERVDLGVALANYARFLDIKKGAFLKRESFRGLQVRSILVTNTKFTAKAMKYCRCNGVEVLGWNCPRNKGLEHLIDSQKLYPITILPSLKGYLQEIFVARKMMLAKDILKINPFYLAQKTGVSETKLEQLIKEANTLLG